MYNMRIVYKYIMVLSVVTSVPQVNFLIDKSLLGIYARKSSLIYHPVVFHSFIQLLFSVFCVLCPSVTVGLVPLIVYLITPLMPTYYFFYSFPELF